MPVNVLIADSEQALRNEIAKRLLNAAYFVADEHKKDLSRLTNPAPHKTPAPRGAYPALRTGFGRSQVTVEETSLRDLAQTLKIRIGIREPGKYLLFLSRKGWLGLEDTAKRVQAAAYSIIRGESSRTRLPSQESQRAQPRSQRRGRRGRRS